MAIVVLALAQPLADRTWQLVALRLLLGLAIGTEFAIGPPLLAEFLPAERRGRRGAGLVVWWYAGFLGAVLGAYGLVALGVPGRWMLVGTALPAVVTLLMRLGLPESPRWLASRGRVAEARRVVRERLADDPRLAAEVEVELAAGTVAEGTAGGVGFRGLFGPVHRRRTVFACVFWTCLVAPYFALAGFAPRVFAAFGLDERAGAIALTAVAALGALAGVAAVERLGRRQLLIGPFWVCAAALAVLGLWAGAPVAVVAGCVLVFAFVNSASAVLCAVYPSELFPTAARSAGVGLASAASRLGAAAGTFLLPLSLAAAGIGPSMLAAAGVCVAGALASRRWAPETSGRQLADTPAVPVPLPHPPAPHHLADEAA